MNRIRHLDKVGESGSSGSSSGQSAQVNQAFSADPVYSKDHSPQKPKCKSTFTNFSEHYCIIIKPKLYKSCSLSDLTSNRSELLVDYQKAKEYLHHAELESAGDWNTTVLPENYPMSFSRNLRSKKQKKKKSNDPQSLIYTSNFATEYIQQSDAMNYEASPSELIENACHDDPEHGGLLSFPFKQTPSGNLKVQSNQVVFQSSTVGVLLADPTNAKVKVKFEGNAGSSEFNPNTETACDPECLYGERERNTYIVERAEVQNNAPITIAKEDNEKDLKSLGYSLSEPVDWSRVQLPKKSDLYQEFYRRILNYINTDVVVRIGDEDFHCHLMVLRVYSGYFDNVSERVVELPKASVSAEAFQTIYEWMMFCGSDSHKALRRDNILDLFCAAQYLTVKDLEEQCWSFIVNEELFTEDTAFTLFQEARLKDLTPVMELMVPRVMRFFLPLVASSDFLSLSLDEITVFLSSNYICVTSEMEVLMAAVRWLRGDWTARRHHAAEVMRCVRFGLVSPWQLVDLKRNKDNPELLQMIQEPEVQNMVDDGLAYVIIKYWWYGNNSKNYTHWIDVLGLLEPAERNWIGEEKNHASYKEFVQYLEQFQVPREQAYQQLAMQHTPRRHDDLPGGLRGVMDTEKLDMRRHKLDFPLPLTLKGLGDKEKGFPTMSEFFESRRKAHESAQAGTSRPPRAEGEGEGHRGGQIQVQQTLQDTRRRHELRDVQKQLQEQKELQQQIEQQKQQLQQLQRQQLELVELSHRASRTGTEMTEVMPVRRSVPQPPKPAEKDPSRPRTNTQGSTDSDDSASTLHCASLDRRVVSDRPDGAEHRRSAAANYLAAATAALTSTSRLAHSSRATTPRPPKGEVSRSRAPSSVRGAPQTPRTTKTVFTPSKEILVMANMNRLSHSALGPSNRNYTAEGSLFNWERETVLVMGGVDPHTSYGVSGNTGRDIQRFDPVANVWEHIGELPEPRHHHAVAFLRGRVYLVGGADPRVSKEEARSKTAGGVVGTVWSYEPATRVWNREPSLTVPRKNFGLVVHRMALYAIGGQDYKGRVLKSVERYEVRACAWGAVCPLGAARMGVACAKYREYIWVAGGMTGDRRRPLSRVVECYDSTTDQWTEIDNLRSPRCFSTLFSMNDKLYLIGGAARHSDKDKTTSSVAAMDVWDWSSREWQQHGELSVPRHGHALAYLGTQLIIIGGVTTMYMRALGNVESFCCERQAWIRGVAPLPAPLSGHGAVTLPPASLM